MDNFFIYDRVAVRLFMERYPTSHQPNDQMFAQYIKILWNVESSQQRYIIQAIVSSVDSHNTGESLARYGPKSWNICTGDCRNHRKIAMSYLEFSAVRSLTYLLCSKTQLLQPDDHPQGHTFT
ncbi:hypothetical protein NPIL_604511 [Nephila pilipes]|uniref:Uncharacterized protein n=1 Tax=Nephila pilipes TaxID=299642 RepID=A0A8X6PZ29_NEPPI|nr:hypothetical protein NPIL_604511 [Nephila pilipes]